MPLRLLARETLSLVDWFVVIVIFFLLWYWSIHRASRKRVELELGDKALIVWGENADGALGRKGTAGGESSLKDGGEAPVASAHVAGKGGTKHGLYGESHLPTMSVLACDVNRQALEVGSEEGEWVEE